MGHYPQMHVFFKTPREVRVSHFVKLFRFERLIIRISLWTPKMILEAIRHDGITTFVKLLNIKAKARHLTMAKAKR